MSLINLTLRLDTCERVPGYSMKWSQKYRQYYISSIDDIMLTSWSALALKDSNILCSVGLTCIAIEFFL